MRLLRADQLRRHRAPAPQGAQVHNPVKRRGGRLHLQVSPVQLVKFPWFAARGIMGRVCWLRPGTQVPSECIIIYKLLTAVPAPY